MYPPTPLPRTTVPPQGRPVPPARVTRPVDAAGVQADESPSCGTNQKGAQIIE